MKIERSSIILHLEEKENNALRLTRDLLDNLFVEILDGESIGYCNSKITDEDIRDAVDTLNVILSNAVVD